jgi:hypothetical protein
MSITNALIYSSPSSQDPSGQPGFSGAGNIWAQNDTGVWYIRNSTNTGWTIVGSGDQTSFGLYPLSGGAGSGAITGNTGLMTADGNTPFAIPPTVTNRNSPIATLADLASLQTNLQTLINESVAQSVSGIVTPGINSSIVIINGTLGPAATYLTILQLPFSGLVYPDGTSVQLADCHGFASTNTLGAGGADTALVYLIPQDTRGMSWQSYYENAVSSFFPTSINYQIIAIKPTA